MRTTIRRTTFAGMALLATMALGSASASAANEGLTFLSSFNGSENPRSPAGFVEPVAVAVDQASQEVYVGDNWYQSVTVFSAAGIFDQEFDFMTRPESLDVNDGTGEVLVADGGEHEIDVFSKAGALLAQWNGSVTPSGSFGQNWIAAAVDNSGLPSRGRVYVADCEHGVVDLLAPSGSPMSFTGSASYVAGSQLTGTPAGPFKCPKAVAVDSANGDIYVDDDENAVVDVFNPAGEYLFALTGALFAGEGGLPSGGLPWRIAIDGATGKVYVVNTQQNLLYAFAASGAFQYELTGTPSGSFRKPLDVGVDETSGEVFVADRESSTVDVFQPGPLPPAAQTDPASAITASSATLNGDLNPEGASTGYYFTYGKGASCVGSSTPAGNGGFGSSDVHEEVTVSGLEPATRYSFCLYTTQGQSARASATATFETAAIPPATNDQPPTATVTSTTEVTLRGAVNPNNESTTYYFEYGPTTAYGNTSSAPPGTSIGAGLGDQSVSDRLTGLTSDTVYHYRLIALNAAGEAVSSDGTFTTAAPLPTASTGEASEVTYDAATLDGSVVPGSVGPASDTKWCFEYGELETSGYSRGSLPLLAGDAGEGAGAVEVSVRLSGLAPGNSYRYRLVAVNSANIFAPGADACGAEGAQEADGAEATFTTPITPLPPSVATGAPSAVAQNTATVSGTVDADGTPTSYAFQIGIDTSYGVQIFGETVSGSEPQSVTLDLLELQPGTTYHYRLVASSGAGTVYGADATFTTSVFPGAMIVAPSAQPLVAMPDLPFPNVSAKVRGAVHKAKRKPAKAKKRRAARSDRKAGKLRKRAAKSTRMARRATATAEPTGRGGR